MNNLILLRGLPGSGKTTLAKAMSCTNSIAADDYFDTHLDGKFDSSKLSTAHNWCVECVRAWMLDEHENPPSHPVNICVHNTFTQEWEMQEYINLANEYGWNVHTIVVENRHGNDSVHDVPEKTIEKMRKRFQIKL